MWYSIRLIEAKGPQYAARCSKLQSHLQFRLIPWNSNFSWRRKVQRRWRNFFSEMFEPWPIQPLDWKRISSPHKLQLVCIWHFFLVEKQVGEVCQATHFRVVSLTSPSHTQFTSLPVREYSWSIQTHGTQRYHGSWWSIRMNLSDRKTTKTENNITMEAIENCRCTQTCTTSLEQVACESLWYHSFVNLFCILLVGWCFLFVFLSSFFCDSSVAEGIAAKVHNASLSPCQHNWLLGNPQLRRLSNKNTSKLILSITELTQILNH